MQANKTTEIRRAAYYRKALKSVDALYDPAVQLLQKGIPLEASMVGEYVLSPMLVLFTIWILRSAQRDGVKRLYFLARDGYPAYITASKLCKEYKVDIECRYLYCSRYSLRVPMYSENIEEMLEYVSRNGIDVTLDKILRRAGLQTDEITRLVDKIGDKKQFHDALSYSQLIEIRDILGQDAEFIELVTANSERQWNTLSNYFVQEGLTDDLHIGLVDSGWIGSTQKSIDRILKRMGTVVNIDGYYWGLYDLPNDMDPNRYHGFLFDKKHGMRNKLFFSNCLIETVFSNTHGTTISYTRQSGGVIPVLQENYSNEKFIAEINRLVEGYIGIFARSCSKKEFEQFDIDRAVKQLSKSLLKFMYTPTIGEAEFFGALHFSDDLLDDSTKELGPILTISELKSNHFLNRVLNASGLRSTAIHESAWYSGTVRRSSNHTIGHDCSYLVYRLLSYWKKSL